MNKKTGNEEMAQAVEMPTPGFDQRVDEYAAEIFAVLGFDKQNLPPKLVEIYNTVKLAKDRLQPGRLTSGEFAIVAFLASLYSEG